MPRIRGSMPARRAHETVRRLITRMIEDVIAETGRRAAAHKPRSAAEVRRAAGPLVAFSPAMQKADADIKGFLYPRMYRHERVMRVMGDAEGVVRDLFAHYAGKPTDLPAEWARWHRSARWGALRAPHRRLHRRHDRPLCADRACEIFRATPGVA